MHDRIRLHPVIVHGIGDHCSLFHTEHQVIEEIVVLIHNAGRKALCLPQTAAEEFSPGLMPKALIHEHSTQCLLGIDRLEGKFPALIRDLHLAEPHKVADRSVGICTDQSRPEVSDGNRRDGVITVHKIDQRTRAGIDSCVAGDRNAFILLVDHADSAVLFCQGIADFLTSVRGTVVHENDLQISECLGKNALRTHAQIGFYIMNRNNNRN